MDHTFPKNEKLKSKKLIDGLFSKGRSLSAYPVKLLYLEAELPERVAIQTGVAVPKRIVKRAVGRNRIKRLLREAYRLNKQQAFNNTERTFAFLFLYLGKEEPSFVEIDKSVKRLLKRFGEQVMEKSRPQK